MNCPNCQIAFNKVQTDSQIPGLRINLEQCSQCGGIWFDQYELYQVPAKGAYQIDKLDEQLLAKNVPLKQELFCPKDNTQLKIFKDYNLPRNIDIERCPTCGGLWFNKGELSIYKTEVGKKQIQPPDKEFEKLISSKLEKTEYNTPLMSNLGHFMMPFGLHSIPKSFLDNQQFGFPSKEAQEMIDLVPPDKKIEVFNTLARENRRQEDEYNKFQSLIENILTIIQIVARIIAKG